MVWYYLGVQEGRKNSKWRYVNEQENSKYHFYNCCGHRVSHILHAKSRTQEQVIMGEHGELEEMTIDEKIRRAPYIVIGEVKTRLPSKWRLQDEKDAQDATPEEISDVGLFTDYIISIDKTLKGSFDEPTIRVRSFSGETEQVRWVSSTSPFYTEGHIYLLFLEGEWGRTTDIDPGFFMSLNSGTTVYEIVDGKATALGDEWNYEELVAYIEKALSESK